MAIKAKEPRGLRIVKLTEKAMINAASPKKTLRPSAEAII
jgi:hypothetical protein